MKVIIRVILACVFLLFQNKTGFSQSETPSQTTRLNWIFLVDGILPMDAVCTIILQQDGLNDTILCRYIVGDVWVPTDGFNQILKNINNTIVLEFAYIERQNTGSIQYISYIYPIILNKSFFNSSFVLFNIENISIKERLFNLEIRGGDGYVIKSPYHRRRFTRNVLKNGKHTLQTNHGFTDVIRMNRMP